MANKPQNSKQRRFSWQRFWMDVGRIVLIPYYLFLRMDIYDTQKQKYREKLRGGALILANHSSFRDPFYVGCAFRYRRMYFMTADVVMKNPFVRILLTGMGCVSINREAYDIQAMRKITALAKDGQTVAIFPQGGVHRDNDIQEIKNGAILIAIQAGVPLVPIYTCKPKHFYNRQIAVVGETLHIDQKMPSLSEIDRYSAELLHRMQNCQHIFNELTEGKTHE